MNPKAYRSHYWQDQPIQGQWIAQGIFDPEQMPQRTVIFADRLLVDAAPTFGAAGIVVGLVTGLAIGWLITR